MNILSLGKNNIANFINIMTSYRVVTEEKIDNPYYRSYDAIIINIEILDKFDSTDKANEFLTSLENLKIPIIIVYSTTYVEFSNIFGGEPTKIMDFISSRYKIEFNEISSGILETDFYYTPEKNARHLVMKSDSLSKTINIRNSDYYYIVRKNTTLIMHDIEPQNEDWDFKYNRTFNDQSEYRFVDNITGFINYILSGDKNSDIIINYPQWIDDIIFNDDETIIKKLNDVLDKMNKLDTERKELIENQKCNRKNKSILYLSGKKLTKIVKSIIEEMLDIPINNDDIKEEDLSFKLEKKIIVCEVKGKNTGVQREYISQVENHIRDVAKRDLVDEENIENHYKGLLIITPFRDDEINARIKKPFYSEKVISDIKYKDICCLDTLTLLSLYSKFLNKKYTTKEFWNLILNTNYNEPNFDVLNISKE